MILTDKQIDNVSPSRCECCDCSYWWYTGFYNPYPNGRGYQSDNHGSTWFLALGPQEDFCFKTYGYNAALPKIEIVSITGGFRVTTEIRNNGTGTANDVNWSIDLEGGLILMGGYSDGTINELGAGESTTVRLSSLFGIGNTVITVTAGDAVKQASGFMLGPLVLNVQEL